MSNTIECSICGRTMFAKEMKDETLFICFNCGYGRPSIQTPMEYGTEYEKKYLSYPENALCKIRMDFVEKLNVLNRRNLIDFGCGSGAFVHYARGKGYAAYGFDVNDFTAHLRPPKNFTARIVTAWDSFEHLTDEQQAAFFHENKRAEIIVVSVPDFESCIDAASWRHYRPREHLHYYTEAALRTRFKKEGLTAHFCSHDEDAVRSAPWKNNILSIGFVRD